VPCAACCGACCATGTAVGAATECAAPGALGTAAQAGEAPVGGGPAIEEDAAGVAVGGDVNVMLCKEEGTEGTRSMGLPCAAEGVTATGQSPAAAGAGAT